MNEILLRRKNKLYLDKGTVEEANLQLIVTIMKNIESLGFTFSENIFHVLQTYSENEIEVFYQELIPLLEKNVGANVRYKPMYENFPSYVMDASGADLYINAIVHYWSNGELYPMIKKDKRLPLFEETKVKIIDLATEEEYYQIFRDLVSSKSSLSQLDQDDILYFFENDSNISSYLPECIPLKENVAFVCSLYILYNPIAKAENIQKYISTATDILRLATAMSQGDISLSQNTKFKSFRRRERRIIMDLFEGCISIEEDMLRNKNRFIRLGERIHPSEFRIEQYPNTIKAFHKLRNGEKIQTFGGTVANAIELRNYKEVLSVLKRRPGELARKLDHLLRLVPDSETVLQTFQEVASEISTTVLLQVREHFKNRCEKKEPIRVFFPKGRLAKAVCISNNLPELTKDCCSTVVRICEEALLKLYEARGSLGRVYLSEDFKQYIIPFSQRSASNSIKTMVRGSRISLEKKAKALRAFIWWTNDSSNNRIDIDLSAAIFDENWKYIEHVSYTNLRSKKYKACHSGDITNGGPNNGVGVSEFLDVDIDSVLKYGARYIVYQVYNFTQQLYENLPNCTFGWMERNKVNAGEIFEPRTVKQNMKLMSASNVAIPVIFDCVTREAIWCDMNLSLNGCYTNCGGNNVESNLSGVALTCYSMVNMIKPSMYDLINLHIRARGIQCYNKEEADIIFDVEDGVTPFNTEIIMSQYL